MNDKVNMKCAEVIVGASEILIKIRDESLNMAVDANTNIWLAYSDWKKQCEDFLDVCESTETQMPEEFMRQIKHSLLHICVKGAERLENRINNK